MFVRFREVDCVRGELSDLRCDDFAAIVRGTNGSVRHPRPYRPSAVSDLALTGGSATVAFTIPAA
jgi:hypothetical protein